MSFSDEDSERAAAEARSLGVDVAELRIDRFSLTGSGHVLDQVRAFDGLPVLATVRSAAEGGGWRSGEAARLELFREVAPLVDAVDVELSSREILADVIAAAHAHDALAIVSHHNFDRTPGIDDLRAIARDAREAGADIVKISTMATDSADLKVLASLLVDSGDDSEMIVIAMGEIGTASRIFFPALGSRLTYTFIGHQPTSGQLDFAETSRLVRKFHPGYDRHKGADHV
ncbi:type I 3-dehydroquinate dehydratase [Saccharothrix sp. 6-C]|uniref:type I 3-dehydroquinate dehydratase n=1 Tax=Saccharothrix sp. 6-C TaxID=2781735 RepID=UPI0019172281|nr:type I 3-dehydroquinate dehydratase [Saccharothrix sp. 6-C]QQQ75008.1 type I 3-dehydroquinate dehydratase [Saccharothrix sp. 6-C]